MNQASSRASNKVTVLVFKDNYAARTFDVSLSWINRLGVLFGIFLALTLGSGFLAIKYYRISLMSGSTRSPDLDAISQIPAITPPTSKTLTASTLTPTVEIPIKKEPEPITSHSVNESPATVQSTYQFSAFADTNIGTVPSPADLTFTIQTPKLTWKGKTLLVRFALQYVKTDQANQQGRIVILARSPEHLYAYPNGILNLPGKTTLISPEKGEFFSVSRFREVKADFGPFNSQETISSVEIFIFDTDGKILVYQALTPSPKNKSEAPPTSSKELQ